MPNWCVNQVDITGNEAEVEKLIEFVREDGSDDGDNLLFSFRKIVPVPTSKFYAINEGQNDFQCGCKQVWVETKAQVGKYDEEGYEKAEGHWCVDGVPVNKVATSNGTIEEDSALMFGGRAVCPLHNEPQNSSHPDWWYNWNVANWGTKWGAGDVWNDRDDSEEIVDGKTSYNFDTAWAPAEPVVAALAEQFPTLEITHRYCEGGMGFAGEVIYRDGGETIRREYGSGDDSFPDEAYIQEEDGSRGYERNYDAVPQTEFEAFCEEHFGGIVGG
jgi:hypothetical protein